LKNELIGFLSTVLAIVIFLTLRNFYKFRFEKKYDGGKGKDNRDYYSGNFYFNSCDIDVVNSYQV